MFPTMPFEPLVEKIQSLAGNRIVQVFSAYLLFCASDALSSGLRPLSFCLYVSQFPDAEFCEQYE